MPATFPQRLGPHWARCRGTGCAGSSRPDGNHGGINPIPRRPLRLLTSRLTATVSLMASLAVAAVAREGALQPRTPAPASPSAVAPPAAEPLPDRSDPRRLEHDVRISVDTNAPPASQATTNTQKALHLQATWQGWDGLFLELNERTFLPNTTNLLGTFLRSSNAPVRLRLDQVQMTARLGARLEVDGAGFVTRGDLSGFDDGVQLRRAFFNMAGDCILLTPLSYRIQVGYIPNNFYINEAYLKFSRLDYLGYVQFGEYAPPMGLDLITSSRDITFMEPAAPLQAVGPPNETGLQIGHPVFHQRATWAFGLFGETTANNQYGNSSKNYGNAIGRLTWLAIDHLNSERLAANHYLHLGLSANFQYSASRDVRYRARPESYLAPYVIDTGDIDAAGATTVAAEAAWVNGPFSVLGEFIHSFVQQSDGNLLNFGGFYGQASWYLTGESRPYNPATGAFERLIPRRNFNFGKGGDWGALEVGVRYSYTDLTDANVQGGRLNELMAGLNWYLNPHLRWVFNCGMGHVSGGTSAGNLFIFQTRIGVDF
jgi:phosphate-selective porin OprO and OprP